MNWKCRFYNHVFRIEQSGKRDKNGNFTWPCYRCGKVFTVAYGLELLDHGTFVAKPKDTPHAN